MRSGDRFWAIAMTSMVEVLLGKGSITICWFGPRLPSIEAKRGLDPKSTHPIMSALQNSVLLSCCFTRWRATIPIHMTLKGKLQAMLTTSHLYHPLQAIDVHGPLFEIAHYTLQDPLACIARLIWKDLTWICARKATTAIVESDIPESAVLIRLTNRCKTVIIWRSRCHDRFATPNRSKYIAAPPIITWNKAASCMAKSNQSAPVWLSSEYGSSGHVTGRTRVRS